MLTLFFSTQELKSVGEHVILTCSPKKKKSSALSVTHEMSVPETLSQVLTMDMASDKHPDKYG